MHFFSGKCQIKSTLNNIRCCNNYLLMKVKKIYKPYKFAKKKNKDIDKPKLDLSSDNWRIFMNFPQFCTSNVFSVSN